MQPWRVVRRALFAFRRFGLASLLFTLSFAMPSAAALELDSSVVGSNADPNAAVLEADPSFAALESDTPVKALSAGGTTTAPAEDAEASPTEPAAAPGDAPRLSGTRISLPPPPSGFNVFDGGWIRFYYHPSVRERIQPLIEESTVIRRELSERLGVPPLSGVRVDIARTPGEMATFAPPEAPFPEYASGVAYSDLGLVLLTLAPVHPNDRHDLVQTFRHEIAHVALHEAVRGAPVPRWFNEGFAVLASGETSFERLQTLWTATVAGTLLPLARIERSFPAKESRVSVAYAQAVDVVRFLIRDREHHRFHVLVQRLRDGNDFRASLLGSYGINLEELEHEWRRDVAKRYTFWPVLFSGSVIWTGILGLFVLGWRKRRARMRATLARWAREEAREDQMRQRFARAQGERVHIVLARSPQDNALPPAPTPSETEVPRVHHDGQWYTLH